MSSALRLIFLGPPGAGKGTQAQKLCEERGLANLSSGDVLRREIRAGSPLGERVGRYVRKGELVPDEVMTAVMLETIAALPPGTGFVLDGFPRTVPQAESLDAALTRVGDPIHAVLDFEVEDATIIERIVHRRVCTQCGSWYNTRSLPPKVAGVCDRCGAPLAQRDDDREEVVRRRLTVYRTQTAPLIAYYERQGLLRAIDAAVPAEQVEQVVRQVVASLDRKG